MRIDLLLIQGLGISLESFLHYLIQGPPWTKSNSKEVYVLLTWERKKITIAEKDSAISFRMEKR